MIISASDLMPNLMEIKRSKQRRKGVSTGYHDLDELFLLSKQYLMVVTGMPSMGKSEVLDAIAVNTAILHDWRWLYFSPENFPLEEHLKKFVEKKAGDMLDSLTIKQVEEAAGWVDDHFAWIHPAEDRSSLLGILSIVEQRIQEGHQVDCIVIDPWNELDHSGQQGQRDDQYISKCLTTLRRFHREYNLLTCVVIHPTKLQKDKDGRYPIPNLYDCNGGAMWRNKCDFGLCVHREDLAKHEAHIHVQKVKFKTMGKTGKVVLDYEYKTGRFKCQLDSFFNLPAPEPDCPF